MFRKLFIALVALVALFALNAFAAVDANRASQAELQGVKGIGPALSAKILKARESGTFKDWGNLVDRVSGIGPGNAPKLSQAGLTVGGASFGQAAPAAAGANATHKAVVQKAAQNAAQNAVPKAGNAQTADQPSRDRTRKAGNPA